MKRKILFLIESLGGGGAEKVLTTLVQNIDKSKFDVTVCVISGGGKYEEQVKACCNYHAILNEPKSPWLMPFYVLKHHLMYRWLPMSRVYRLFVHQGYDVEVAFVEGFATKLLGLSGSRSSSGSKGSNVKRIAWVHNNLHTFHWTKMVFRSQEEETRCYNQYDKIIGVADTVLSSFHQEFPEVSVPLQTLYNPIDSEEIIRKSQEPITCDSRLEGTMRLVSIGRLEPQKAYDRLIRIVSRLTSEGYILELWLLGDGSQREYLSNLSNTSPVRFLGFQTNPYPYLYQCDLFVCSSLSEGYSTAVTEALILGLPVVTTDCSGMAELLRNGECGIITENDEEALYQGLKRVLDNPALYSELKTKAVQRGREFNLQNLMQKIEEELW